MYYSKINKLDVSNGSGVRVSLFVSGCRNNCEGCFNKETWNFKYGNKITHDTIKEIITELNKHYINGFSLLGGEPMDVLNQEGTYKLLKKIKPHLRHNQDIWLWTGYALYEDLLNTESNIHTKYTNNIIKMVNYIVDGKFDKTLYDYKLKFRGSSNQHIYKVINNTVLRKRELIFADVSKYFIKF